MAQIPGLMRSAALSAVLTLSVAGQATAQQASAQSASADENSLQEVVVTAQRREERLQDVPLAVSAFSAAELQNLQVNTIADLDGRVPNAILEPVGAFPFAAAFTIRGIGFADVESTFEPAVGVEVNGVYIADNVGAIVDLYDVDGIEVLRGPQGTLYGRNTIGGVVSLNTKRPTDDFHAEAQETLGSFGRREFRAAVEGAIMPGVLDARVSTLVKDYGGYYHDITLDEAIGGEQALGFRGTLLYTPTSNFEATLILDYLRDTGTGPAQQNVSLPNQVISELGAGPNPNDGPYTTRSGLTPIADFTINSATLEMNWTLGAVKLTSITGERETDYHTLGDYGGEAEPFLTSDRYQSHHQFSEEIRAASADSGPLKWVGGLYFMDQYFNVTNYEGGIFFGGPDVFSYYNNNQLTRSYAAFGQLDWTIIPDLTATVGGRYSYDDKTFDMQPLFSDERELFQKSFDDFSPKAALSYHFTPDILAYAQYSRGYRAGGFNGRAGTFAAAGPYGSENVNSYEVGLKNQFLDRRLTLNLAAFTSKYNNMQQSVQEVVPGTTENQTLTVNASSATIRGVESEFTGRITRDFTITGSLAYLDAYFNKFNADLGDGLGDINRSNLPLDFTPRWNASLDGNYKFDTKVGTVTADLAARYSDRMYTSFSPINAYSDIAVRPSNTIVDGTLAWSSLESRYRVAVWVKNLANRVIINNSFPVSDLVTLRLYEPPREFGVDIGAKF
jgi:iron complex outermembrane receptor protein